MAERRATDVAVVMPILLRIEARRPAVWLSLVAAAAVPVVLGSGLPQAAVPAAIAAGGLVAVAAVGRPPVDRGVGPAIRAGVLSARLAWPCAGAVLVGLLSGVAGSIFHGSDSGGPGGRLDPRVAVGAAVALAIAAVAAAGIMAELVRRGRSPAAAATLALALVGAAAFAALVSGRGLSWGWPPQAAAASTFGGLLTWSLLRSPHAADWQPPLLSARTGPEVGSFVVMATTLAAMVAFFFLVPQWWWGYAVVACGWFVCLAVPAATSEAGGTSGSRLCQSAAGRPRLPGSLSRAAGLIAVQVAILAWPATVAGLLSLAGSSPAGGPLLAVAALATLAILLLAVVAAGSLQRGSADTSRASVLAVLAVAVAIAASGYPLSLAA
jgi:hypothetical protein